MSERLRFVPTSLRLTAVAGALAGCSVLEARQNVPIGSILPTDTDVPTETSTPTQIPTATQTPTVTPTATPEVTLSPTPIVDLFSFEGINLERGENHLFLSIAIPDSDTRFTIETSPVTNLEDGCSREGSFRPLNHTSCNWVYPSHGEDLDIAHYVHTGYNNETETAHPAEPLRRWLEDDLSTYNVRVGAEERNARMARLEGARVTISRNDEVVEGLQILSIVRVPPALVPDFERAASSNIFVAGQADASILRFIDNGENEMFLIICGRRTDDEVLPEGVTLTEAQWSRYIIVIGRPESPASTTP